MMQFVHLEGGRAAEIGVWCRLGFGGAACETPMSLELHTMACMRPRSHCAFERLLTLLTTVLEIPLVGWPFAIQSLISPKSNYDHFNNVVLK